MGFSCLCVQYESESESASSLQLSDKHLFPQNNREAVLLVAAETNLTCSTDTNMLCCSTKEILCSQNGASHHSHIPCPVRPPKALAEAHPLTCDPCSCQREKERECQWRCSAESFLRTNLETHPIRRTVFTFWLVLLPHHKLKPKPKLGPVNSTKVKLVSRSRDNATAPPAVSIANTLTQVSVTEFHHQPVNRLLNLCYRLISSFFNM